MRNRLLWVIHLHPLTTDVAEEEEEEEIVEAAAQLEEGQIQGQNSHEVPVQALFLHLAHQVHQATLEKDLKAQIVFDHQRGAEATLHDLRPGPRQINQ